MKYLVVRTSVETIELEGGEWLGPIESEEAAIEIAKQLMPDEWRVEEVQYEAELA